MSPRSTLFDVVRAIWLLPVGIVLLAVFIMTLTWLFPKQPQIVVQMPCDAAPLEQLVPAAPPISPETKVITQERAVLWVTVFKLVLDKGFSAGYCADQADRAVKIVYGAGKP